MRNCWFHCGWMEILSQHSSKHYTHIRDIIEYIIAPRTMSWDYRSVFRDNLHFTSLHFTSPSVLLQPLLLVQTEQLCDGVYYLTIHVILKGWVKMVDSFVNHTINEFAKWDLPALILHTMTHSLHITAYFSGNYDTSLQECFHWHLLFHLTDHHLRSIYSLFKQQKFFRRAISDSFMGNRNITRHSFIHNNTYYTQHCLCHTKLISKYKNNFFSGNLHCPIPCVSL
jgi:hypothetical protein